MNDLRYALHGVPIHFHTENAGIAARLQRQWQPFRGEEGGPALHVHLRAAALPPLPPALPAISRGPSLTYYGQGADLVAYFQGWGRYNVDLATGRVDGIMSDACLATYGVFEDMIVVALAPLLRRRGLYTIHAFAASLAGRAAVLIGDIGAGKTSTGLSLLADGARLIANDSPLLRFQGDGNLALCAYPGLLSTYADAIAWFPDLAGVLARAERLRGSAKLSFAVDDIWPERWQMQAPPGALFFPQIVPDLGASFLQPLGRFHALQRLVAQSIEDWDSPTIPGHLRILRLLVDSAPAYALHLAPDVDRLPRLIGDAMPG